MFHVKHGLLPGVPKRSLFHVKHRCVYYRTFRLNRRLICSIAVAPKRGYGLSCLVEF